MSGPPHRRALDKLQHPQLAQALGQVRRHLDLLKGHKVHVACSGGADSVCMLWLLSLVGPGHELSLSVGHVDHGLRPASAAEQELVEELAQGLGLPFRATQLTLAPGAGLAARARDARRAALWEQAHTLGAKVLALAHTATDQAETLLMHLTRGAGLDGLGGMPSLEGGLFRPLLGLSRAQTHELCQLGELDHVRDPSNDDEQNFRVELRKQVLPRLRAHNPGVDAAFSVSARSVAEAHAALQIWVQRELEARRRVFTQGASGAAYELHEFAQLPIAVRTGLLRSILVRELAATGADVSELRRRLVLDLDRAIQSDQGQGSPAQQGLRPRRFQLPGGGWAHLAKGQIWVTKAAKDADLGL